MKSTHIVKCVLGALLLTGCQQNHNVELKTIEQKSAYSIGASMGQYVNKTLTEQESLGLTVDKKVIIKGFADSVLNESKLDQEEIMSALQAHSKKLEPLMKKRRLEDEEKKKAEIKKQHEIEKDYLSKNKTKEGIKETESGLQYEIIHQAKKSDVKTSLKDNITVHYTGKLIDGTVFDSSVERGEPATFDLSAVIKGWQEGLQLMTEGDKYRFTIPSNLAYGDNETGSIPAGSILIFDIELIKINNAD